MILTCGKLFCGFLLCCLVSSREAQTVRGRILELEKPLYSGNVTTTALCKIGRLKGVVSLASFLKLNLLLHTKSHGLKGVNFLSQSHWVTSKVSDEDRGAQYAQLDKGSQTPGSGPSPGGNNLPFLNQHKAKSTADPLPNGMNTPPLQQKKGAMNTRQAKILKEGKSESEKQVLDPILKKSGINEEKHVMDAQLLPEGVTPPSGTNVGRHGVNFIFLERRDRLVVNSLPQTTTPPSGPNPGHNLKITPAKLHMELVPEEAKRRSGPSLHRKNIILKAMEVPDLPIPAARSSLRKSEIDSAKIDLEIVAKGWIPPRGPNKGHNRVILTGKDGRRDVIVKSLPNSPSTSSEPDPMHKAPLNLNEKPAGEDDKEFCGFSSDSHQNLSELVGCQQDIMSLFQEDSLSPAALFSPGAMPGMHQLFSAGIAKHEFP